MNFQYHSFKVKDSTIYLLEFFESFEPISYLNQLSSNEMERYLKFLNPKRKKEFVATRILKHSIFGHQEIKYKTHGAPYLAKNDFISISHATNLVGIAVNPNHAVGFDIELIHPKVLKLHEKFLNTEEINQVNLESEKELIAYWSMKESLYKLAGEKELDFKTQLLLEKSKENEFKAQIILKSNKILVNLHYFEFKNYILSINLTAPEYV